MGFWKTVGLLAKPFRRKKTETAKQQLELFIAKVVEEKAQMVVDFFNEAEAINTRLHQFELLPGFGKKHTEAILQERKKKPFGSLADLKKGVSNLPDPKKAIEKRLVQEITGREKYYLFTK